MSLGPWLRRTAYWSLDAANGGPVRRDYRDIVAVMSNEPHRSDRIERILDHASRTTTFYSSYRGLALADFPVVDRTTHKKHPDGFRSSAFAGARLHERTTSGTTGMPFRVALDAAKRTRMTADVIYFNELAGQQVGDRLMWFRTWLQGTKSPWQRFVQNVVPYRLMGLDDAMLEEIVQVWRRQHVNCVLANASALIVIARYIERKGIEPNDFRLRVAISGGETLDPNAKRRIEAAFGCPVVDRYANEENGILASTTRDDARFLLNRASFHFEFLTLTSDEPESPGRPARVVLTDLYNLATPMIRYDTGDLAIVSDVTHGIATTLESVQGRKVDCMYDTLGRELTSGAVSGIMQRFDDIARYQLVQENATTFRLLIVMDGSRFKEDEFRARVVPWLGPGAELSIEFVDDIPEDASGKVKTVVANYRPAGLDADG